LHDISHEIKQTAAGIKSAAKYVIKDLRGDNFFEENNESMYKLSHIVNSVESLLALLPVLKKDKSVKKMSTSRVLGFRPYADLCKPICETFRGEAMQRGLSFTFSGRDQLGNIFAVLEDFRHIFLNIISNAVKYTYRGREITVRFQRPANSEFAMIHVMSESLTIRQDEVETIFTPGYRSISVQNSKIEGEGRGLPIARGIARQYNGDVVFRAHENYNIFSIIIPKHLFTPEKIYRG
jgi:signal transduction histidine kinase